MRTNSLSQGTLFAQLSTCSLSHSVKVAPSHALGVHSNWVPGTTFACLFSTCKIRNSWTQPIAAFICKQSCLLFLKAGEKPCPEPLYKLLLLCTQPSASSSSHISEVLAGLFKQESWFSGLEGIIPPSLYLSLEKFFSFKLTVCPKQSKHQKVFLG